MAIMNENAENYNDNRYKISDVAFQPYEYGTANDAQFQMKTNSDPGGKLFHPSVKNDAPTLSSAENRMSIGRMGKEQPAVTSPVIEAVFGRLPLKIKFNGNGGNTKSEFRRTVANGFEMFTRPIQLDHPSPTRV